MAQNFDGVRQNKFYKKSNLGGLWKILLINNKGCVKKQKKSFQTKY